MAQTIGFVGLGQMGGHMALRFLNAGHEVVGTARRRDRARWLVDKGVRWQDTPGEVAEAADVVFTSLPDDDALTSVAGSLLGGLVAGKTWIDTSTVSPRVSRALASRARAQRVELLDAPVSGSVAHVKAGALTIMVGGSAQGYLRVEPLLDVLGSSTYVGGNGQGLVLKLAININLAAQMLAFSEGLLLAERAGVNRTLAAALMAHSAIGSPMLRARVPLVLDGPDEAWFDIGLMRKAIRLALATAGEADVRLPTAGAAAEVLAQAGSLDE
jgi:3-hydroxyisobutyrate dehydrogenase-like beta-hydroxyacid dehydrogenase